MVAMTAISQPIAGPVGASSEVQGHSKAALTLGALGVVFGDIGTSPLYAFQATLDPRYHLNLVVTDLYGIASLIFWSFVFVVTIKYVFIVMRCDNKGEGGSLALYSLIQRRLGTAAPQRWLLMAALFATALFYADAMLTPAISVISAVEGLGVVSDAFKPYIVWIALAILISLFAIQRHGTDRVGKMFGPVMLVYFAVIAAMGVTHILGHPQVFRALNPIYIWGFFTAHPLYSFLSLGAVVYAITGTEALYADMGHFGRKPIASAWLYIVMPALVLNYLGQAAMLIQHPEFVDNPFFRMVPPSLTVPLLGVATLATIIASQAVISGAYSVTHQAIQLGFLPRMRILHTSSKAIGQIYLPGVNWALAAMVGLLVVTFGHSSAMLPAYGLAVVGTMLITTLMQYVVVFRIWKRPLWQAGAGFLFFLSVDLIFLASGSEKLFEGAWFPIVVGLVIFTLLTTWATGRSLMRKRLEEELAASRRVHQVGRIGSPGPGNGGVPVDIAGRGSLGAASQSEAQPGASRARPHPQREGRGCAARPRRRPAGGAWRTEGLLQGHPALRLHGRGRHSGRSRPHPGVRRGLQHDEHQLLPRPPEADRGQGAAGNGAVA